jgi:hypothetical protein
VAIEENRLAEPPLTQTTAILLDLLVCRILQVEQKRGAVSKIDRAHLAEDAQPAQDIIDRLLFSIAGFSNEETGGIEERIKELV